MFSIQSYNNYELKPYISFYSPKDKGFSYNPRNIIVHKAKQSGESDIKNNIPQYGNKIYPGRFLKEFIFPNRNQLEAYLKGTHSKFSKSKSKSKRGSKRDLLSSLR